MFSGLRLVGLACWIGGVVCWASGPGASWVEDGWGVGFEWWIEASGLCLLCFVGVGMVDAGRWC